MLISFSAKEFKRKKKERGKERKNNNQTNKRRKEQNPSWQALESSEVSGRARENNPSIIGHGILRDPNISSQCKLICPSLTLNGGCPPLNNSFYFLNIDSIWRYSNLLIYRTVYYTVYGPSIKPRYWLLSTKFDLLYIISLPMTYQYWKHQH